MAQVFEGVILGSWRELRYNTRFVFLTDSRIPKIYEFDGNEYQKVCRIGSFTFIDNVGTQVIEGNDSFWYIYPKSFLRRDTVTRQINFLPQDNPAVVPSDVVFYSEYIYDPTEPPTVVTISTTTTTSPNSYFVLTAGNLTGDNTVTVDTPQTLNLDGGVWMIDFNFTVKLLSDTSTSPHLKVSIGANGSSQPSSYTTDSWGNQRILFRCESTEPFQITPYFTINKTDTTGTLSVQYHPGQVQILFTKLS